MTKLLIENHFRMLILFSGMALFPLLLVYILEYFFGVEPCKLCIYERIPFFVVGFLPTIFVFDRTKAQAFKGFFVVLMSILCNVALSFYHWGIENKWFANSLCAGPGKRSDGGLESFFLSNQTLFHNCSEVKFRLLGMSLAGWNFFYCLGFFVLINFAIARHFFIKSRKLE